MLNLSYSTLISGIALVVAPVCAMAATNTGEQDFTSNAWSKDQTSAIFDKTLHLRLPYDAAAISEAERQAVMELVAAGKRMHQLYLDQKHHQAVASRAQLDQDSGRPDLQDLFRLMKGPVATTLDNQRQPFLSVDEETPGKNVYPPGMTREIMDSWLEQNPGRRNEILHLRSVIRETTPENVALVLATLNKHPVLDVLHPGLRERIQTASGYISIPYSVVWADDILFVHARLSAAADLVEGGDPAFARFLRLRARDLLADDYEGGDAAWVTGKFLGNLNAQIGSYETYDDALYGVKSFFSLSLLQRDQAKSDELMASIGNIQAIEDALPYETHKTVRSDIPVSVYNVVADFGQSRGTNTATILPNESHLSRQYGRTILIRASILLNPELFNTAESAFNAATHDTHHGELTAQGGFYRTLWHEIGHYLGVDLTHDGRDLGLALQDTADLMEEMKSDLVSLFSARMLHQQGQHDDARLRAIRANGILRVLQKNQPRRTQAYQTMQLIQWNWYLDRGLLEFEDGRMHIRYERYPEAVDSLLKVVLDLQYKGDRDAANAFVEQWTSWDEALHGAVAQRIKDAERYRFRLVRYEVFDE
jgi:hypothetical protein